MELTILTAIADTFRTCFTGTIDIESIQWFYNISSGESVESGKYKPLHSSVERASAGQQCFPATAESG